MVAEVSEWDLDPSNNGNKDGIPMYEGMTPAEVNNGVRAVMAAVRKEHDDRVAAETAIQDGVDADIAAMQAIVDALVGFTTGDIKTSMAPTPPSSWVKCNGGTIGNAASGADRANADTEDLFTLLWENYDNTILPILDSAGVADVRGADAATDYAANKRMPVFDFRGEFPRGYDDGRGVDSGRVLGTSQTDLLKNHTHSISPAARSSGNEWDHGSAGNWTTSTTISATGNPVSGGGAETRPRNIAVNYFIKL